MNKKSCAVIVCYKVTLAQINELLHTILPQVELVVIIDNGSDLTGIQNFTSVHVIANKINLGVATAINQGIEYARQNSYEYVLCLDQDSVPSPDLMTQLYSALDSLSRESVKVGAVGARIHNIDTGDYLSFVKFRWSFNKHYFCINNSQNGYFDTDFLISSGCLIPLKAINKIGQMDDGLFIDNVDLEWCFRARNLGYRLFGVCSAVIDHQIGDRCINLFGLKMLRVRVHAPIRLYYIMRNRIILYRRGYVANSWKFHDLFRLILKLVIFGCLITPRIENFKMMSLGMWHGLAGRMGKYQ